MIAMGCLQISLICQYLLRLVFCAKAGTKWPILHPNYVLDIVALGLYGAILS